MDEKQYKAGDLLSVKDVADVLGVTEDWVRKLIRRDKKTQGGIDRLSIRRSLGKS